MTTQAVILAAGASSRMGMPKPLIVRGKATLLEEAAAPFARIGVGLIVVTGFHADRVEAHARALPAAVVRNASPDRGMASSVRAGLRRAAADLVFVQPVDCPGVRPGTLAMLVAALAGFPGAHAAVPLCHGRRGHPVVLDRVARSLMLTSHRCQTLRDALVRLGAALVAVETGDRAVLRDLDTPEDVDGWRTSP